MVCLERPHDRRAFAKYTPSAIFLNVKKRCIALRRHGTRPSRTITGKFKKGSASQPAK